MIKLIYLLQGMCRIFSKELMVIIDRDMCSTQNGCLKADMQYHETP
jgi:hypothetical protein